MYSAAQQRVNRYKSMLWAPTGTLSFRSQDNIGLLVNQDRSVAAGKVPAMALYNLLFRILLATSPRYGSLKNNGFFSAVESEGLLSSFKFFCIKRSGYPLSFKISDICDSPLCIVLGVEIFCAL